MKLNEIKLLPILLVVLLCYMQYHLWFEAGGIIEMLRLKKKLAVETEQNEQLKIRNQALIHEVQHLQKNDDVVESRARRDLGMIKKGETFYQVVR